MVNSDRIFIGDLHNFGKRVQRVSQTEIMKPRTVFWEYLFLDERSAFRKLLTTIFENFEYSPLKSFLSINVDILDQWCGMETFLELEPCDDLVSEEFCQIGSSLAFWSWCGLIDLHCDNIKMGRKDGHFVFMPVDIEGAFYKISTMHDTLLISAPHGTNLEGISLFKGKVISLRNLELILSNFIRTIEILNLNSEKIFSFLNVTVPIDTPVRLILRATREYSQSFLSHSTSTFFKEEIEQLRRNDIPYFFTFWKNLESIYYFSSPNKISKIISTIDNIYFLKTFVSSNEDLLWSKGKTTVFVGQLANFLFKHSSFINHCLEFENSDFLSETKNNELKITLREVGFEFFIKKFT